MFFFLLLFLPVEVEYAVEDLGIPVEEELVALDDVVVAQLQLLAVVGVRGQPADPGLGVPGGEPVGQQVRLQRSTDEPQVEDTPLPLTLSDLG